MDSARVIQLNTEYAALELVERVLESLENNEPSIALFLDLSKAFDSLDHSISIEKLRHYGFSNQALELIKNYLRNRIQYVEFNGVKLDKK